MKKTILVEGIILAYVETNPSQQQTIFFIHHNSGSSSIWAQQLEEPSFSKYRLIAFDLPAHGDSSAAETPEQHYGLKDLGRIMSQVIIELAKNEHFILIGLSIGTCILAESLAYLNPKGVVLVSPTVVGEGISFFAIVKSDIDSSPLFTDNAPEETVHNLFSAFPFAKKPDLLSQLMEDYYRVKAPFRSTIFEQSIAGNNISNHIRLLNESCVLPLVVIGEEEEVIKTDYLESSSLTTWKNTLYKVPAAGHFVPLDQPEVFNRLLSEYAAAMFKEYHV